MADLTADAIRAARQRLGLTQTELAARLHVTVTAVSNWETGRRTPTGLYAAAVRRLIAESKEQES